LAAKSSNPAQLESFVITDPSIATMILIAITRYQRRDRPDTIGSWRNTFLRGYLGMIEDGTGTFAIRLPYERYLQQNLDPAEILVEIADEISPHFKYVCRAFSPSEPISPCTITCPGEITRM
jgi:hypothetical protein